MSQDQETNIQDTAPNTSAPNTSAAPRRHRARMPLGMWLEEIKNREGVTASQLAEHFGARVLSVREVLQRLRAAGLVQRSTRHGQRECLWSAIPGAQAPTPKPRYWPTPDHVAEVLAFLAEPRSCNEVKDHMGVGYHTAYGRLVSLEGQGLVGRRFDGLWMARRPDVIEVQP